MIIGSLAESLGEYDRAIAAYESALRFNPYSVAVLTQLASIYRLKEFFPKAVEYFQRVLNIEANNGEIWGALGHCYLMMDELPKAYAAYQQALHYMSNPKEPKLWYGIGILYDRYGSFEHAEEAFSSVLKMDPKFEKSDEIYFRLGIIYKQLGKYDSALQVILLYYVYHISSSYRNSAFNTLWRDLHAHCQSWMCGFRLAMCMNYKRSS